jgi:hypothetical protein
MASSGRVRYDRDLEQVIFEPVGGPVQNFDGTGIDGAFDVYQHTNGNYGLSGGDGWKKTGISGHTVKGATIPNTAVTSKDLMGKDRQDTPVIGSNEAQAVSGAGTVPDAVLIKAGVGQTPNIDDAPSTGDPANLGAGAGQ